MAELVNMGVSEKKATRDGFGNGVLELFEKNSNVVAVSADLSESTKLNLLSEKFSNRLFEVGVAEANMVGIASGLSIAGKIPFASTFCVFCPGRCYDQLRVTVGYGNLNVKLGSTHGGITVGADGASHQGLEDIALMRVLPNFTVLVPCDAVEAKKATIASAKIKGPVYLRFGRDKVPVITSEETHFEIGKALVFKEGSDVAIIACGIMVYEALAAAKKLQSEGIDAAVINLHTIKPIDEQLIIKFAKKTGAIVTAEEHQLHGGMGSAVLEVLGQEFPVPVKMVGIKDVFGESGSPAELMKKYGLTSEDIVKAVKEVLELKK